MIKEIETAVDFMSNVLRMGNLTEQQLDTFKQHLQNILIAHYEDHWFPEKPFKGSAYRCLRICGNKMDTLMARAGAKCGLSESELLNNLPPELSVWCDPREVSYRIGEEGSIGVVYDAREIEPEVEEYVPPRSPSSASSGGSGTSSPVPYFYSEPSPMFHVQHHQMAPEYHSYVPEGNIERLARQMTTFITC